MNRKIVHYDKPIYMYFNNCQIRFTCFIQLRKADVQNLGGTFQKFCTLQDYSDYIFYMISLLHLGEFSLPKVIE